MLMLYVVVASWRHSPIGTLLAVTIAQVCIGTTVVPILIALGIYAPGFHGQQYAISNPMPELAASVHILLFSIGSVAGWRFGIKRKSACQSTLAVERLLTAVDPFHCAITLLCVSFAAYFLLFFFIDWEVLLLNARNGSIAEYGELKKWLFLKSVASLGIWATCFLPSLIPLKSRKRLYSLCLLILIYVLITYVLSISRNLILLALIVPAIIVMRHFNPTIGKRIAFTVLISIFAGIVLLYGKSYNQVQRAFVTDGNVSTVEKYESKNTISALLANLEFQWYSVDAGITAYNQGYIPPIGENILATSIGFVPSGILELVGAPFLAYSSYGDHGISNKNSRAFHLDDGSVPPGTIGYSAYLCPFSMGFGIGFVFLFLASSALAREHNVKDRWLKWFWTLLFINWFTFIPMACALATFAALFVFITCASYRAARNFVPRRQPIEYAIFKRF